MVPGHYCLVTELAEKGNLDGIIHQPGTTILFPRKLKMAEQVAMGLNWLHLQQPPLLHLDIKPANLLVMADWTIKIADFGMSRFRSNVREEGQTTQAGIGGTPLYMPPEMYELKPEPTEKCDVFAFAVVLWELHTQLHPFAEFRYTGLPSLINGICTGKRPTIPADTPPTLKALLESGWHQDPNERRYFQDILRDNVFERILTEAISEGAEVVETLMMELNQKAVGDRVPWDDFHQIYCRILNHPLSNNIKIQMENLKTYLDVKDGFLDLGNFIRFTQWWKPLKGHSDTEMSTLEELDRTMKELWFWGDRVDQRQASEHLIRAKPGSFLVRCGHKPGRFIINYLARVTKKEDRVLATELYPYEDGSTLVELVAREVKSKKLKIILPGRSLAYRQESMYVFC